MKISIVFGVNMNMTNNNIPMYYENGYSKWVD